MKPSLEGVDLKLGRADECLAFLHRERTRLLNAKGNAVVGHFDPDSGDYVFRVPGDPPPLSLGITVGEFAHALRSALDNMLWQLVLARGGTPTSATQFPIYEDRAEFQRKSHGTTQGRWETRGVLAKDFAFIYWRQPFRRRPGLVEWHPLAMLAYLNNVDKHRFIHAAFAGGAEILMDGPYGGRPFFQAPFGGKTLRQRFYEAEVDGIVRTLGMVNPFFPVEGIEPPYPPVMPAFFGINPDDPAEIARVIGSQIGTGEQVITADTKVNMNPGLLLEISFSDWKRPMSIFDLVEIRTAIQEIVERFRPVIG